MLHIFHNSENYSLVNTGLDPAIEIFLWGFVGCGSDYTLVIIVFHV